MVGSFQLSCLLGVSIPTHLDKFDSGGDGSHLVFEILVTRVYMEDSFILASQDVKDDSPQSYQAVLDFFH